MAVPRDANRGKQGFAGTRPSILGGRNRENKFLRLLCDFARLGARVRGETAEAYLGLAIERAQLFHRAQQVAGLAPLDGGHLDLDVHVRLLDAHFGQRRGDYGRSGFRVRFTKDGQMPCANRRTAVCSERVVDFAFALWQRDRSGGADTGRLPRQAQSDGVVEAFITDGSHFQVQTAELQDGCRGCVDLDSEWRGFSDGDGKPIDFGPVKNPVARAAHHLDRVAELAANVFLRVGVGDVDIDQR